jgi:protein arginine kinase activator
MKCNICSAEEAPIHITQTGECRPVTIHLCEACAKKMGVSDPAGFSLADLLSAVKASEQTSHKHQK